MHFHDEDDSGQYGDLGWPDWLDDVGRKIESAARNAISTDKFHENDDFSKYCDKEFPRDKDPDNNQKCRRVMVPSDVWPGDSWGRKVRGLPATGWMAAVETATNLASNALKKSNPGTSSSSPSSSSSSASTSPSLAERIPEVLTSPPAKAGFGIAGVLALGALAYIVMSKRGR